MSVRLPINPDIVEWAISRYSLNLEEISRRMNINTNSIESWLSKEKIPTLNQIQKLANALRIPQGYLFLSRPPEEEVKIPDFRTIGSIENKVISPELRDVVNSTKRKQSWLKKYLIQEGIPPLEFIGKFNKDSSVMDVATSIIQTLNIDTKLRKKCSDFEAFFRAIVKRSELNGVSVIRRGYPGEFKTRKISEKEIRGFALCDQYAPFVFVNTNDSIAAQNFTLIHELAHIWIGEEGISNVPLNRASRYNNETENLCNQIAAEVLAPDKMVRQFWKHDQELEYNLKRLSRLFKVSVLVMLIRSRDAEIITQNEFDDFYRKWLNFYNELEEKRKEELKNREDKRISMKNPFFAKNSKSFSVKVVNAALNGEIMYKDAANLLDRDNTEIIDKIATYLDTETHLG